MSNERRNPTNKFDLEQQIGMDKKWNLKQQTLDWRDSNQHRRWLVKFIFGLYLDL